MPADPQRSYIAVRWLHDYPDTPVLLYSELDAERWEVRKVEVYPDGTADFANATTSTGTTGLGEVTVPPLAEIASDPEFEPREISAADFEIVWQAALRGERLPLQ